jgi:hypothetical protein
VHFEVGGSLQEYKGKIVRNADGKSDYAAKSNKNLLAIHYVLGKFANGEFWVPLVTSTMYTKEPHGWRLAPGAQKCSKYVTFLKTPKAPGNPALVRRVLQKQKRKHQ